MAVVPVDHLEDWAWAWQAPLLEVLAILLSKDVHDCFGKLILEHVFFALHLCLLERQHPLILFDLLFELRFLLIRQGLGIDLLLELEDLLTDL